MRGELSFEKPRRVIITCTRWNVTIAVHKADGTIDSFVASADSYFTQGDQIYFETETDYEADRP